MNSYSTLGEKIRYFRKRIGMTQLDLELGIDAASGSISRIENNEVNPTKETLHKIAKSLNLNPAENSILMGIETKSFASLLGVSRSLHDLNLDHVLKSSVNEICKELNLLGSAIFLVDADEVYSKTLTDSWYTSIVNKLLPRPFSALSIKIDPKSTNMIVQVILNQQPQLSYHIHDFTKGVLPKKISYLIENITGHKSAILFPIIYNHQSIGAILFTKNYVDDFMAEYEILAAFVEQIGNAIMNAQQYSKLSKILNIDHE